jgi:choline dehydrogenase-like flavoprotein
LNAAEQKAREVLLTKFNGERLVTNMRLAVITEDHLGRQKCHLCGNCYRGCVTLSYFSSLNSTLPAARKTGNLTLRPFSVVHSVIYDPKTKKASGVRVVDGNTKEMFEVKAKVIFLCAAALESTRILLNSLSPEFPTGLGNSSGELGHNLMDHIMGGGATGELPWAKDRRESEGDPMRSTSRVSERQDQASRFSAWLWLRGAGGARGLGARNGHARFRSGVQEIADRRPRPVGDDLRRIRRDASPARELHRDRSTSG